MSLLSEGSEEPEVNSHTTAFKTMIKGPTATHGNVTFLSVRVLCQKITFFFLRKAWGNTELFSG